jgi:hypothetical protein
MPDRRKVRVVDAAVVRHLQKIELGEIHRRIATGAPARTTGTPLEILALCDELLLRHRDVHELVQQAIEPAQLVREIDLGEDRVRVEARIARRLLKELEQALDVRRVAAAGARSPASDSPRAGSASNDRARS